MPRKDKRPHPISEETRQEDERLRKELENADPEKFKKVLKPLMANRRPKPDHGK
jgi:hypothetical protein